MNTRPPRFGSVYDRSADVQMMLRRYLGRTITDKVVLAVAQAALRATPWAGTPKPWGELTEAHRLELLDSAAWALRHQGELDHIHDQLCCREHDTHATPHRGCILR